MGRKRVGDGGRIQRRVLVDDCRHSERCKFFVVAYTLHIYDPAREKNRCLLTYGSVNLFRYAWQPLIVSSRTKIKFEIKSASNLFRDSNIANDLFTKLEIR